MTLLSAEMPKTFNLLSLGQRGVGKTVFLAGSYAELQPDRQIDHSVQREFWFDCQDMQVQQNMEQLLGYVAKTGQYPPATMKITNFNFNLKRQNLWSEKTLCNFRWWDIPGELCSIRNEREFQKMVLRSHGCCVFINADALVHNPDYAQSLEDIIRQVAGIASLVYQRGIEYPLALILTQCDSIQLGPISQLQIEESLQPLISVLDNAKANYRRFYSAIPIVSHQDVSALKAKGAAASLLWLTSELRKIHSFQMQHDLGTGLMQNSSALNRNAIANKKELSLNFSPTFYKYIFPLILTSMSLIGVSIAIFLSFNQFTLSPKQALKQQQKIASPAQDQEYSSAR